MSWSYSVKATRDETRIKFNAAKLAQHAYQEGAAPFLDAITTFGVVAASNVASANAEITLSTSGHVGADGLGSCSVSLSIGNPMPAPPPTPEPEPEPAGRGSTKKRLRTAD